MKIALTNYTGTVGKTTLATHLLSPRMDNAPIIAVESINQTAATFGLSVQQLKGDMFRDLLKKLLLMETVIVDVGASNIEDFLEGMIKFDSSHLEFDYYLVPVTSGTKEQRETLLMIDTLANQGIPAKKILVIFNRVVDAVEDEFPFLLKQLEKSSKATVSVNAAIFENELFDILAVKKMTLNTLLADSKDYKALLRDNKNADDKQRTYWADMFALKALARTVNRNLDSVYSTLFS